MIPASGRIYCGVLFFVFVAMGMAGEPAVPPPWPRMTYPRPDQRNIDEIEVLPAHDAACPVCGFMIRVPEPEKLMRRRPGNEQPEWEMHAAERDADTCPYPGRGKLAHQADIILCPSCGFAALESDFFVPASPEFKEWVLTALQPNLAASLRQLLGRRGADMADKDVAAFYNRQEELPDRIRMEHARTVCVARNAAKLLQAAMSWRSAWASRRELAKPPTGLFLGKAGKNVRDLMTRNTTAPGGVPERIAALEHLMGKTKSSRDRLNALERFHAGILLAGLLNRHGDRKRAEEALRKLYVEARERFAQPEKDPFWQQVSQRSARKNRERELESIRLELERETAARITLFETEWEYLAFAAEALKDALSEGEFDADADLALFYSYLVAEFHRRHGDLALAAEWYKTVAALEPGVSPLKTAAEYQLDVTHAMAGDSVNFLSAVGQNGEAIAKLREICKR